MPLIVVSSFSVPHLPVSVQVVFTIGGINVTIRARERSATASSDTSQKQSFVKRRRSSRTEVPELGLM